MQDSTNCLSAGACSCNPALKIDSNIGCITDRKNLLYNSQGTACLFSKCQGGLLTACSCSGLSCEFDAKSECECLQSAPVSSSTCSYYSGSGICNSGCSSYAGTNLCTGCKDENAFIGTDKKSFYNPYNIIFQ